MSVIVDDREVVAALKRIRLTQKNMLDIAAPMGLTVVNHQRTAVPKDTHATELSIKPEVVTATERLVTQIIGPSTDYAPSIEFGVISKPNYPIQPFVRPSVMGVNGKRVVRVGEVAFQKTIQTKVGRSIARSG